MKRIIPESELMINADGSAFHLHLRPEQVADKIILVGDPARVDRIAAHFDTIECRTANREFHAVTGTCRTKRVTVLSTGIGTDNIDIVLTELDALVNVDFATRQVRDEFRRLTLLRLGTCGTLQPDIRLGDMLLSTISIGFDGLLNFYRGRNSVCRTDLESEFMNYMEWNPLWAHPYFIESDATMNAALSDFTRPGMTVSAPGFYAPQGRWVRLETAAGIEFNRRLSLFQAEGLRVNNYEMESSALAGLARLMGHRATTVCVAIAQRAEGDSRTDYQEFVDEMIKKSLEKLINLE